VVGNKSITVVLFREATVAASRAVFVVFVESYTEGSGMGLQRQNGWYGVCSTPGIRLFISGPGPNRAPASADARRKFKLGKAKGISVVLPLLNLVQFFSGILVVNISPQIRPVELVCAILDTP
jgi:hypothetical protein